jgi:hypothetical protein
MLSFLLCTVPLHVFILVLLVLGAGGRGQHGAGFLNYFVKHWPSSCFHGNFLLIPGAAKTSQDIERLRHVLFRFPFVDAASLRIWRWQLKPTSDRILNILLHIDSLILLKCNFYESIARIAHAMMEMGF